jgi:uncharacterized protein YndB with AHSA1/START domain
MNDKMHFEIDIKASVPTVWKVMLDLDTYKQWTTPFDPGSTFEGSWEKGSKIRFLSADHRGGMVSEIAENIPHNFISIKHLGIINEGHDDVASEEAKKWSPAFENYTFTDADEGMRLQVDIDTERAPGLSEMREEFEKMWPKALQLLKTICEAQEKTKSQS